MKRSKLLASALAFTMMVTAIPASVFAEETEDVQDVETEIGETEPEETDETEVQIPVAAEPEEETGAVSIPAYNADITTVEYVDPEGYYRTHEATLLTGDETELAAGWYTVDKDISYDHTLYLGSGEVNIILTNGNTISFGSEDSRISADMGAICVSQEALDSGNSALSIFGQTDNLGSLEIYSDGNAVTASTFNMYGGNVTLDGTKAGLVGMGAISHGFYMRRGNLNVTGIYSEFPYDVTIGIKMSDHSLNVTPASSPRFEEEAGCSIRTEGDVDLLCGKVYLTGDVVAPDIGLSWSANDTTEYVITAPGSGSTIDLESTFMDSEGNTYRGSGIALSSISGKTLVPAVVKDIEYVYNNSVKTASECFVLTEDDRVLQSGYWYVDKDLSLDHGLQLDDDAFIILGDGADLSIGSADDRITSTGIDIGTHYLYICPQSGGTGALEIYTTGEDNDGISGSSDYNNIYVHGGHITIDAEDAKAISIPGTVTIYSGNISASGTDGIAANNIYLEYSQPSDSIYAVSYGDNVYLTKEFADKDNPDDTFQGQVSSDDIAGKTLVPVDVVTTTYVDENGDTKTVQAYRLKQVDYVLYLSAGTYLVDGTVTLNQGFRTEGDVRIILADGAVLEMGSTAANREGIRSLNMDDLTIYGQEEGSGQMIYSTSAATVATRKAIRNVGTFNMVGGRYIINYPETGSNRYIEAQNINIYGGEIIAPNCSIRHVSDGSVILDDDEGFINYYGGKVEVKQISAEKGITLSWKNDDDSIFTAAGFFIVDADGTVSVKKPFTSTGDDVYIGEYGIDTISQLGNKTLVPGTDLIKELVLEGYSAKIEDGIGMNFYYSIPSAFRNSKTKFSYTVAGVTKTIDFSATRAEEIEVGGKTSTYYYFPCDIYPTQLTESISWEITYDGVTLLSREDFQARDYFVAAYTVKDSLQALAVIKYGAKCQLLYDVNTGDLADKDIMDVYKNASDRDLFESEASLDSFRQEIADYSGPAVDHRENDISHYIEYYGASVVMKEKLYVKYYYRIVSPIDRIDDFTAEGGYEVGFDGSGNFIYVKVPMNYSQQTEQAYLALHRFTSYTYVRNYSAMTYIHSASVSSKSSDILKDTLLYMYMINKV